MKVFVALSALLAIASATPLSNRLIVPSSQYHSQDGFGQYSYGYNDHLSAKQEIRSLGGITKGSYSYIDSNNVLQTVNYIADAGGFRVAATNTPKPVEALVVPIQDLPQQVSETPEVAAARLAHLAAVQQALQSSRQPKQVQDTPEVALAKAAHFAAIEEAKKQIGYQVISVPSAPIEFPQPVEDTPEVVAARAAHFVAIEEAKRQVSAIPTQIIELPKPIADTPEVAQAKAEHLIAIEQAKLRNSYQPIQSGITIVQSAPSHVQVPRPSSGFSYSSSAPVLNYAYSPYVRYHQLYSL